MRFEIEPKIGLGNFILGMNINQVLTLIKRNGYYYKHCKIISNKEKNTPIFIYIPSELITLRFNYFTQNLELIEKCIIYENDNNKNSSEANADSEYYYKNKLFYIENKNKEFHIIKYQNIAQLFGLSKVPKKLNKNKNIFLEYSGIGFYFTNITDLDKSEDLDISADASSVDTNSILTKFFIFREDSLYDSLNKKNTFEINDILIKYDSNKPKSITIKRNNGNNNNNESMISIGDNIEDVLRELKHPNYIYYSNENNDNYNQIQDNGDALYNQTSNKIFYLNYFKYGFDIMICNNKVNRIILHTNQIGDSKFGIYERCNFKLKLGKDYLSSLIKIKDEISKNNIDINNKKKGENKDIIQIEDKKEKDDTKKSKEIFENNMNNNNKKEENSNSKQINSNNKKLKEINNINNEKDINSNRDKEEKERNKQTNSKNIKEQTNNDVKTEKINEIKNVSKENQSKEDNKEKEEEILVNDEKEDEKNLKEDEKINNKKSEENNKNEIQNDNNSSSDDNQENKNKELKKEKDNNQKSEKNETTEKIKDDEEKKKEDKKKEEKKEDENKKGEKKENESKEEDKKEEEKKEEVEKEEEKKEEEKKEDENKQYQKNNYTSSKNNRKRRKKHGNPPKKKSEINSKEDSQENGIENGIENEKTLEEKKKIEVKNENNKQNDYITSFPWTDFKEEFLTKIEYNKNLRHQKWDEGTSKIINCYFFNGLLFEIVDKNVIGTVIIY